MLEIVEGMHCAIEIVEGMHCAIYKAMPHNFRQHLLKSIAIANDNFS